MMRRFHSLSALLLCLVGLTSCAEKGVKPTDVDGGVEGLASWEVQQDSISFTARSTGCSSDASFKIYIDKADKNVIDLTIVRVKPDFCRRMPFWQSFTLTIPESIRGKELKISNPIVEDDEPINRS
ncbi:hypothetical protein CS022_19735 [Veronia nyctiphanis]|uniref:Uncharacterized protein n=1 Tax=Veronia nyctiphanis TaxID=1278244 RepID=A0A4V1LSI3_9GAMM|nr:hypothetical protein [Veronia nyctiphanis]RXJ71798.1 hypothetical protein CS022_19735 [Veronia nyctiphanis]